MASNHIGFIALHLVGEDHGWLFFIMPPRSSVVICYASVSLMDQRGQFAHSTHSAPYNTDTRPTLSAVDDVQQQWCRSGHQSVWYSRGTHSVDGPVPCHQSH